MAFSMPVKFLILSAIVLLHGVSIAQERNYPLNGDVHNRIERIVANDSIRTFTSLRPLRMSVTPVSDVLKDTTIVYYDFQEVVFTEHLLRYRGKDFFFSIDPLFNFEVGWDLSDKTLRNRFWNNTRGAILQADLGDKVSIASWIYENQGFYMDYLDNYIRDHGELRQGQTPTYYFRIFGVVPGQGRAKEFRDFGHDFSSAGGYVSISPIESVNLQFGHFKQFIGSGYRSMLLSDMAFNYPQLRVSWDILPNLRYQYTWAWMNELRRLSEFSTPEAQFLRKVGTMGALAWTPNPKWEISLFEGTIWQTFSTEGPLKIDPWLYSPLMFTSLAINGMDGQHNVWVGLNAQYRFSKKGRVYGQLMLDDIASRKLGTQLGAAYYDLIPGLVLQTELNHASSNTFRSDVSIRSISHYNEPLAHPWGQGFTEGMLHARYEHPSRVFGAVRMNVGSVQSDSTGVVVSRDLFSSPDAGFSGPAQNGTLFMARIESGLKLNVKTNMELLVGYFHRQFVTEGYSERTNYIYFALRTNLRNLYYDF